MFDILLFLYFFTLHADQLNITLSGFSLRLNNLIALALFILFVARRRSQLLRIDRTLVISFLVLSVSLTLSFLLSPYKGRCFFFLGWYGFTLLMYMLFPYLLIYYYDSKKVLSLYMLSFLVVGVYASLQLVLSLLGFQDPFGTQIISDEIVRPNAFAYEPSFYALYMTPFIVMVNYHFLANREKPFFVFGLLTYSKILCLNLLYFVSTSTSAFFAFVLFCTSLLFIPRVRRQLWKYSLVFAVLFLCLGVASPFIMKKYFLKFFYSGLMEHGSFYERWIGIERAWKVFLQHPFFGVGFGGYPPYLFDAYLSGDAFLPVSINQMALTDALNPLKLVEAMNVCTEILASTGAVGALAFAVPVVLFIRRAKKAMYYDPILAQNLLLSVIVMVIVLQINQGILRTYVWVHFGLAFALVEKTVREAAPHSMTLVHQEGKALALDFAG
ncbi:MAG: hypothetical protein S4CHLAM2_15190 [Chlamydiales bacterium]|nr:hypothetical protein [Chlamydiales bacterium]